MKNYKKDMAHEFGIFGLEYVSAFNACVSMIPTAIEEYKEAIAEIATLDVKEAITVLRKYSMAAGLCYYIDQSSNASERRTLTMGTGILVIMRKVFDKTDMYIHTTPYKSRHEGIVAIQVALSKRVVFMQDTLRRLEMYKE